MAALSFQPTITCGSDAGQRDALLILVFPAAIPVRGLADLVGLEEDHLRDALPLLAQLPRRVDRLARQVEQGEFTVATRLFPTEHDRRFVRSLITEFNVTVIGTAAAVTGMLLLAGPADRTPLSQLVGVGALFVGLLLILRVVTRGLRNGN